MQRSLRLLFIPLLLLIGGCVGDPVASGDASVRIASVTPDHGPGGTPITIHGSGFGHDAAKVKVLIGGAEARVIAVAPDAIEAIIPGGIALGEQALAVAVTGAGRHQTRFTVTALLPPEILSIVPSSGHTGDTVAIHGRGFGWLPSKISVAFGDTPADILSVTDTSIAVVVPKEATTAPVTLRIGDRTAASGEIFRVVSAGYARAILVISNIDALRRYASSPDGVPNAIVDTSKTKLQYSIDSSCGSPGCARVSGDTIAIGAITVVIDTARGVMRSATYTSTSFTQGYGNTTWERGHNWSSRTTVCRLADLPYVKHPDGELVVGLSGSQIDGHIVALTESSSGESTSGVTVVKSTTDILRLLPFTPDASIRLVIK